MQIFVVPWRRRGAVFQTPDDGSPPVPPRIQSGCLLVPGEAGVSPGLLKFSASWAQVRRVHRVVEGRTSSIEGTRESYLPVQDEAGWMSDKAPSLPRLRSS